MSPEPLDPQPKPSTDQDATPPQTPFLELSPSWYPESIETREVRKAKERADRAARRADRAARRVREAQQRAVDRSGARQLVDAAGDAATAALTAVSAAADVAQAKLAAKARMRELEHAIVSVRAGGIVDVTPPTREEALKLVDRVDPGSSGASFVRGLGFILAGIFAFAMMAVGGFGWLGLLVPLGIIIVGGSLGDRIQRADRRGKAEHIQIELTRASLDPAERASHAPVAVDARRARTASPVPASPDGASVVRPRLLENGDPQTRDEVIAVLDRLVGNVVGWVPETDVTTLKRIRERAAFALPATDEPLDLSDHDVWLLRQICIDYLPRALEHFIALPSDLASEPLLDGRSARQALDEQLALIERRLDEMAARSYRREATGLLTHGRFLADSLRPDPFETWIDDLAANRPEPVPIKRGSTRPAEPATLRQDDATRTRERA